MKNIYASLLIFLGVFFSSFPASAINLTPLPPYLSEIKGAPMVMLNMSKDHQLFFKAYNEYSDLDGDGVVETQYKHSYKYYGYFDNQRCYSYNITDNRYVPIGKVDEVTGYCNTGTATATDTWNGNFMNWATMARMDVVRRILYGGFRAVDTTSAATPSVSVTVLERAHLPTDAHAFAKYYYGTDINKLTPFNPAVTTFTIATGTGTTSVTAAQITMCNASFGNGAAPATTAADAPSILVAQGNHALWNANERWQCYWSEVRNASNGNPAGSGLGASSSNPSRATFGLGTGYAQGSYTARVEVCKTGLPGGFTADEDSRCKLYPRGNHKPVGLLQKYGEENEAAFGLMTGSFDKNISGGVLRKNVASFADEVNSDNGLFTTVTGIVSTLNKLKVTGYDYGNGTYEGLVGGCNFQQIGLVDGECRSWGNPMGEMYLESLRYLAGATANTDFTVAGAPRDTALGLTVTAWSDPFATSTVAKFGDQLCRRSAHLCFVGNRLEPRHHPLDIGVDRHRIASERNSRNRRRGIIANPGQRAQPGLGIGKSSRCGDDPRARNQVARPRIIAKPRPFVEHILVRRSGQRLDVRPALEEARKPGNHRRDRRLLQHHLAQPHPIRVGARRARRRSPRQHPRGRTIMVEQGVSGTGGHRDAMA